jgi:hypothetical protein
LKTTLQGVSRPLVRPVVICCAIVCSLLAAPTQAANITWIGGNVDWVDGIASNANWSPADEPDADDTAIFNTANAVNLGGHNAIQALTMSAGIDLLTNDFDLDVNGLVQLTGSSTNLVAGGADSLLTADSVTINNLANLELDGGTIQVNEEAGNGLVDINAGGELLGHGTLSMTDAVAAGTTLIINDGAITARRDSLIFGAPPAGTLSLNATDADARIDLDGSGAGEDGVVNVNRNQTLDLNIPLSDLFSGTMNLFHEATFDSSSGWGMNGGTINVDNGFVDNSFPNPDVPAGISIIAGGQLALTGGTINILDADGTLQFDAEFETNAGNIVNNGHVIFNNDALIAVGANLTMPTVGAGRTVEIIQANFNMDGANTLTNVITVASGKLVIGTTDYDPDQATNAFDGTINLNGGHIVVTTADAEFVMDGTLNLDTTGGQNTSWEGEPLDIGNDAGVHDADVNVTGVPLTNAQIFALVDFNSDADVNVAAGAKLQVISTVNFDTVNGGNNAEFTGAGRLEFNGQVNVNESVTLNMVGGEVDLDGSDAQGNFINVDAPMVINAATMLSFGKVNSSGGANTLDIDSLAGNGVLSVNLDDPNAEWTLNAEGVINLVNDAGAGTLVTGSDVNLNGTVNVTGSAGISARVDMAGTINVANLSGLTLTGSNLADPNRLIGGTINGPGAFSVSTGRGLRGFGTINPPVAYSGTAALLADDGELTLNGAITDAGTIGTADADGVLNVVNAWNTSAIDNVFIAGGQLKGGTVTVANANGIQGHGTISSRVINNTKLVATDGPTLLVQTVGNDNDWDGAGNIGALEALSGDLEMVDTTGPVPPVRSFGGSVRAIDDNRVYANGFALDFLPGSSLTLENTATYRASSSTDLGGTVTTGAGANATIEVANNFFLTFESTNATTLNGDLTLKNNNINIDAGATFSGGGALIVPDDSNLVADNSADIGVLLDMQGGFRPGNSAGIARVELLDYQQANTGELFVEIIGTSLNQFDRLVADGDVIVDGYLNIDIDEVSPGVPFVPVLGNTFNIITGNSVTGQFDFADVSGMPAGLAFHIAYLANAVQLQVVNEPFFTADFDDDGDVDATDLAIWDGAFDLNQLGDADNDNDSDGADFLLWQQQLGSHPAVAAGGAVPEPRSLALVALGVALVISMPRGARG